jgi:hypothetical protein
MSSYLGVLRHPDFRYLFLGQSASAIAMLVLALFPRSTRELSGERSAQDLAGDVGVEAGRETQITDIDPLVGVMHKRRGLE